MRWIAAVVGTVTALTVGVAAPARAMPDSGPTRVPMTTAKAYDGGVLKVGAVTLSPGRVTWSDNSVKGGAVWTRVLNKTSTGFVAGPAHKLGTGVPTSISASGSRTAWVAADGSVVVRSWYSTKVWPGHFTSVTLSGLRFLAGRTLVDLQTGSVTDVGTAYDASSAELWGDELVYSKADGSIWVRDLAHGTTKNLAGPAATQASFVGTAANRAGWIRWSPADSGGGQYAESTVVDLLTGSTVTTWTQYFNYNDTVYAESYLRGLNIDGWMTESDNDLPSAWMTLTPWDGSASMTLWSDDIPIRWSLADVDGAYWSGTSNSDNRPFVAVLPHPVTVLAQSLGNVSAPATLKRGGTWSLADVASAVVHSCRVDITTPGGKAVRTLGCQSMWKIGEIRATWDGKRADGSYVPAGTYRWTIVAGNGTQSLLNSDGSTKPITGTVAVA